jgi:hypothetical protein
MEQTQVARWRTLAGKAGALFAFLAFLSVVDALVAQFREPAHLVRLLPGETVDLNGALREEVGGLGDLTFTSDTPHLALDFVALHRGYFLGGDMWRGRLRAAPGISPGEYRLRVMAKNPVSPAPPLTFTVRVYADELSRQQAAKSLWRRWIGIPPWLAAAALAPVILLSFAAVFLLSQKMEALLAQRGRAEIYRVVKKDGEYLIAFGLGRAHGVKVGATITLLDPGGWPAGQATVVEVVDRDAVATTPQEIQPGYLAVLG